MAEVEDYLAVTWLRHVLVDGVDQVELLRHVVLHREVVEGRGSVVEVELIVAVHLGVEVQGLVLRPVAGSGLVGPHAALVLDHVAVDVEVAVGRPGPHLEALREGVVTVGVRGAGLL